MKLVSFATAERDTWGIVEGDIALDIGAVVRDRLPDLKAAIAAGDLPGLAACGTAAQRVPLADVTWLPVIPNPDKILCVGLNYDDHRKESGRKEVAHPTIFVRFANSQVGHLKDIIRPSVSTSLDYEGELAVIIGRSGRHVPEADALSYVAGYSCYNDGSIRDWQRHTHQFTPGKNFAATGAFGPWMATADEVGDLSNLQIRTRVNGQVVQDARFGDMIFSVARQIAYCSTFTRLEPGDVIATGTPGGVGAKREPPLWLKPGDAVEVEIEQVGLLRNGVADEASL